MTVIDFETKSRCNIKAGASRYSLDPSTDVLCLAYQIAKDQVRLWKPGDPAPQDLFDYIATGGPIWAHNVTFEIAIWQNVMVAKYNWPPIQSKQWRCTMAECMAVGLPASLENVGKALCIQADSLKDKPGHRVMLKLSKPRKPTKHNKKEWHDKPEDFETLYSYCKQDVVAEGAIHRRVPRLNNRELSVFHYDKVVNARGVKIDRDLAEAAVELWGEHCQRLNKELSQLTDGRVSKSTEVAKLTAELASLGVYTGELDKGTVTDLLDGDINPKARRILEIRQELGLSSVAKYEAMLRSMESDDRIRGCLQYHGAQTGRFAGRLIQPQNFPRGSVDQAMLDLLIPVIKRRDYSATTDVLQMCGLTLSNVLSSLLRNAIIAEDGKKLIVADFAAIEARGLAWAAGEKWLLDAFIAKSDVYKHMASDIYKVPYDKVSKDQRFYGKTTILGCLASDTLVLTDHGWKYIVDVTLSDKVWDGVAWQSHSGVVFQGMKQVINHLGVSATPDHMFLTTDGWQRWDAVATNLHVTEKAKESATLPFSGTNDLRKSGVTSHDAIVGLFSFLTGGTLTLDELAGAINVLKKLVETVTQCETSCQMTSYERDFLTGSARWCQDVTNQVRRHIFTTEAGVSLSAKHGVTAPESFYDMSRLFLDMIIQNLRSTVLTMVEVMNLGTFASPREAKIASILVFPSELRSRHVSYAEKLLGLRVHENENTAQTNANSKVAVWDIMTAGERNRFTILTNQGPMIAHNCGYSMGAAKFQLFLEQLGIETTFEFCEQVIKAYRDKNKNIVASWYATERAAVKAVEIGKSQDIGPYTYHLSGNWLKCRLPAGRDIAYYKPELVDGKFGKQIRYIGTDLSGKPCRTSTYSGKLVENNTQAICRDLLVDACSRLEKNGYPVTLTVHDEIICEVPEDFGSAAEMEEIMCEVPAWAKGFPISAEGFEAKRYRK